MASIILGSVGAAVGGNLAGNAGAIMGKFALGFAGQMIDQRLFSSSHHFSSHGGGRLRDLSIQSATHGIMLPVIFGTVRLAGNLIWAQSIQESAHTSSYNMGGKGSSVWHTHTAYSYSASFAVSICEGEINEVQRIWADNKLLDLSRYKLRIYTGSEHQLPDPLIEGVQGVGKTPAYRGQAYVVFENFPLGEFGNSLPNLTFEVKRSIKDKHIEQVEELIESVVIIPGSGEFVYDTVSQHKIEGNSAKGKWCQRGKAQTINQHNLSNKANALVALDQMQETLPQLKWTAPVVTWFATGLDAGNCQILPGVEYKSEAVTQPSTWKVANFTRSRAHQITKINDRPVYGGTINDDSLLRYLAELRRRNFKIMLYPMFFMEVAHKPWRGRLTGTPASIKNFFNSSQGYNEFILHYAQLAKDKAEAFVIGSELIGLTKIRDEHNRFPAVDELIKLAKQVRAIMGAKVIITYAADWSEYHHTEGGWYNLDPLWASPDIDVIGIDAYFPLTEASRSIYEYNDIVAGWKSGEGYDFYYHDSQNKSGRAPLAAPYAWKNIAWWWENAHINPDGNTTPWQPRSKKIWFTEYGFPSVDCCSNQPNVFYDPTSQESRFPYLSQGRPDFRAQRVAILGTEKCWLNSDMIERKFLWTWDARPYPFWPDLEKVWADGQAWLYGHWVQGKFGLSSLSAVVSELCSRAGLQFAWQDCSKLHEILEGMIIDNQTSVRSIIEILQQANFFDVVEKNEVVEFLPRAHRKAIAIAEQDLLPDASNGNGINYVRTQEAELPRKVDINFINTGRNYRMGNQHATREHHHNDHSITLNLPICMTEPSAQNIADITLYNLWMERTHYRFVLPASYAYLAPGDLLKFDKNPSHVIRVNEVIFGNNFAVKIEGVAENPEIYSAANGFINIGQMEMLEPLAETYIEILDLPALPGEDALYQGHIYVAVAASNGNWEGATIFVSPDETAGYEKMAYISRQATMGTILSALPGDVKACDEFTINLVAGKLDTAGENLAVIGDEVIGFTRAQLTMPSQYQISGISRGRYGTPQHDHIAGERFILISSELYRYQITNERIGHQCYIKAVTNGGNLSNSKALAFTYQANSLKPYSPANLKYSLQNDGALQFSWQRRSRIHTAGTDIPLGEEREEYCCEFLTSDGKVAFSTVVYTPLLVIPNTHLGAEKSFVFRVTQVSAVVGRGFFAELKVRL